MSDIVFVGLSVAFFATATLFARFCDWVR